MSLAQNLLGFPLRPIAWMHARNFPPLGSACALEWSQVHRAAGSTSAVGFFFFMLVARYRGAIDDDPYGLSAFQLILKAMAEWFACHDIRRGP